MPVIPELKDEDKMILGLIGRPVSMLGKLQAYSFINTYMHTDENMFTYLSPHTCKQP